MATDTIKISMRLYSTQRIKKKKDYISYIPTVGNIFVQ